MTRLRIPPLQVHHGVAARRGVVRVGGKGKGKGKGGGEGGGEGGGKGGGRGAVVAHLELAHLFQITLAVVSDVKPYKGVSLELHRRGLSKGHSCLWLAQKNNMLQVG